MNFFRRAVTVVALSLLSLQLPATGAPAVEPSRSAQAHLLAALRSKVPIARLRCLEDLGWIEGEAPTRKDGRLNACLQCDEDRSGPVFKATAGRTVSQLWDPFFDPASR